jgi:dolichyl-phosphate beta-glucosyltransferase
MPTCHVVLPLFNEGSVIAQSVEQVAAFATDHPEFTFCFVNDGSLDETERLLREALARVAHPQVTGFSYPRNRGKGYAIKQGFLRHQAEVNIFFDGDLAFPLKCLLTMRDELKGADIVIGTRRNERRSSGGKKTWRRKIMGASYNLLMRGALGLPYEDTQAGLKGFRREALACILDRQQIDGFGFDAEWLYIASLHGLKVAEMPVEVAATHSYKIAKLKLLRDSVRMLRDLGQIRWHHWRGKYE